ncbi:MULTISPECIES: aminotransferase class V-fold PLP-dependent enzyme [Streptomyces]|uniref:pyridoxal phosphate-dependent decarboxylase family protein n=1 Tax=Streptomyces TaxID=1883 RepID=UPI00103E3455|nr:MULTISPECIES: aminotransferase class V-fold PLP-dependent enzyme [Streptomyces]MBT3074563.1 aminotransferase class V-fold PLP-dependent enzyme [Streptomyces sp. COG21]MBT3082914.1 aminotransferase class V-fold PLP-dependent enzyme [Streptomyces sp. COG20]MBT3090032.1 aminotransferase class V-fold PLP-dependent enzyme [Streptomyces sp. CYG21]MBT3095430.1 aminotransferase class V-fold PLP-dependent enzyme [Streptomyces sp. CBG30]MBT3105106.1 aminotransferase class V-fold PLP-dependent enzyme 
MKNEQSTAPDDWDDVLEACRPHLATLLDTQRDPTARPVYSDDPALHTASRDPAQLPQQGLPLSRLLESALPDILDRAYCNGAHPQYFGYFHPRPLPVSVLGDAVASLLNQSPAAWRMGPAAAAMEIETLSWVADFIGYPTATDASLPPGIFTSGGSLANLTALKAARDHVLGPDAQLRGAGVLDRATVYTSSESHYSIARALDILGMGRRALRVIPAGPDGRIGVDALHRQVTADTADGLRPVAVVGLAGATATGAVDPLTELASIAAESGAWFHVDGAAAAAFADLPATRPAFAGLDTADSVTLDPHKWMFLSYGLGCLLVRDPGNLATSFADHAHYWNHDPRDDFVFLGPEGARPWKSLGLWLALRSLGRQGYADLLARNLATAHHLAGRVHATPGLELLCDPVIPICCFRPLTSDGEGSDALTLAVHETLTASGSYYTTICRPGGTPYLRVAINNYTTREEHVDGLVEAVTHARATLLG